LQPDRIDRYEIMTELARSASGRILFAQDMDKRQGVAIKEMLVEDVEGLGYKEQVQRFQREAHIHLQLDHANIIKAVKEGSHENRHYLVLEYQPGETWHQIMKSRRRSPMPQILEWGIQLCRALAHCHERGVVHRDVKPMNCLISPVHQLKLIDFGMARMMFAPGITQGTMLLGTLNYMSPEQLIDPKTVDGRTDVFAAGVILFKALTNQLPFDGETPGDMAQKLLYAEPTNPRSLNPLIPESLARKLLKCLNKDPDFRYLSAEAFRKDLEEELENAALYMAQGLEHVAHDEWKDANHCFQQAVAIDGTLAEAWYHLGESLQRLDQPRAAIECFLKVIQQDSSHVRAYRQLGEAYAKSGNLPAASKMLSRAWTLDPRDRDLCLSLARIQRESGQLQEAADQLDLLVEHHPDFAEGHHERGRVRYSLGQVDEALSAFRTAHRLAPTDGDILFNLASLNHERGFLAEAEELYDRLIVLSPDRKYTHAHHNLAHLWLSQGRLAEAEAQLLAVLSHERWGPSYLLLGQIYEQTGRLRDAIEAYQTAAQLLPDLVDAPIALATALQRSFNLNAAVDLLLRTIDRHPGERPLLLYHLAIAYRTQGDLGAALQALRDCLAASPSPELARQAEALQASIHPPRRPRPPIFG